MLSRPYGTGLGVGDGLAWPLRGLPWDERRVLGPGLWREVGTYFVSARGGGKGRRIYYYNTLGWVM